MHDKTRFHPIFIKCVYMNGLFDLTSQLQMQKWLEFKGRLQRKRHASQEYNLVETCKNRNINGLNKCILLNCMMFSLQSSFEFKPLLHLLAR